MPVDASHVAKSRKKRTVVGLYSYAPWLTNDVIMIDMACLPRLDVYTGCLKNVVSFLIHFFFNFENLSAHVVANILNFPIHPQHLHFG